MEEDILLDLKKFYIKKKIEFPKDIVWLRPTHPLRCLKTFNKGFNLYKKNKNSTLVVHETDSRLFYIKKNYNFLPAMMASSFIGIDLFLFLPILLISFYKVEE